MGSEGYGAGRTCGWSRGGIFGSCSCPCCCHGYPGANRGSGWGDNPSWGYGRSGYRRQPCYRVFCPWSSRGIYRWVGGNPGYAWSCSDSRGSWFWEYCWCWVITFGCRVASNSGVGWGIGYEHSRRVSPWRGTYSGWHVRPRRGRCLHPCRRCCEAWDCWSSQGPWPEDC